MIELDGKQYAVKTGQENADDIVEFVNNYCTNHNITNTKGELINISPTLTNPLYIIIIGLGYLVSILQNLIYSLACGFSIPNASDKQLLNLADIAGIKRGQRSKTTINLLIYASLTEDCSVYTTDTVTINNVVYNPAFDLTIAAGGVGHVILVAQEYGSYTVSEDSISDFDSPISNMRLMKQYASIPGSEQETIESLRERLQRRTTSGTQIDKAADAIRALEGVTLCNIYFNPSSTADYVVDEITVGKRSALILVQGYNDNIAAAFFQNCLCNTTPAETSRTITQTYTTKANQQLSCYIVSPKPVEAWITVYLGQLVNNEIQQSIRDAVMSIAKNITAGQSLASADVLALLSDFATYKLLGVTVGESSSIQSYKVTPAVDALYVFNTERIVVDMTGAEQ